MQFSWLQKSNKWHSSICLARICLALLVCGLLLVPQARAATEIPKQNNQVIIILAPFVTWDDITPDKTPVIFKAIDNTAIGDLNARSRVKEDDGNPSLIEGALTISSGAWPKVDSTALAAYNATERIEQGTASEVYSRITGLTYSGQEIVYLGLPKMTAFNKDGSFTVIPGNLGSAIEDAGGVTAAIGNSDLGYGLGATRTVRPSAIAAMNKQGTVMLGEISEQLLERVDDAPYGVQTNLGKFGEELKRVKGEIPTSTRSLIVLDPGDGFRASQYASEVAPEVASQQWNLSLATLDNVYEIAHSMCPDATIILASQASRDVGLNKEGMGPLVFSGLAPQFLSSDSTQRPGLVTNLDVSASVYQILNVPMPAEVLGTPIYGLEKAGFAGDSHRRIELLSKMNKTALSVDKNRALVVNTFVAFTVLILLFGAFIIMRADKYWQPKTVQSIKRLMYLVIMAVLAVPPGSWIMFLFDTWPQTPAKVIALLGLSSALAWLVAFLIGLWKGGRLPLIFLSCLASVAIITDQLFGAPFSYVNFFGYSPILAYRFYGIGNEGAALLFGAVVIALVLFLDQFKDCSWLGLVKQYGIPLIGFFVMLVCAAPWWGANVGVAAWATVGFTVLWMLVNGYKITWKSVLLMGIAVVAIVAVFIAIDMYGSNATTHLARSVTGAKSGGISTLAEIVVRKAQTNLRVLTMSMWGVILLAVVVYLVAMRIRPTDDFARTLATNRYFGDGMTAILVAGFAAYFTEDSGIVLPAIMVLYLGCGIVWLMLARLTGNADLTREEARP